MSETWNQWSKAELEQVQKQIQQAQRDQGMSDVDLARQLGLPVAILREILTYKHDGNASDQLRELATTQAWEPSPWKERIRVVLVVGLVALVIVWLVEHGGRWSWWIE